MSMLQARTAGWRGGVLRRDVSRKERSNEASAGPSGGTSPAAPGWPQAVDRVAMDSSKPERFQFKLDHPRRVDRYIDYFGEGTMVDAGS